MEEVTAGASPSDHKQAIRERLKQIRELLWTSRYRPMRSGDVNLAPVRSGGTPREGEAKERASSDGTSGTRGGRAGGIYALFLEEDGDPGREVAVDPDPDVVWISAVDPKLPTRTPELLEDRAAKYLPEQNVLQINADFRVFNDMIDRWCRFYPDVPGARDVVTQTAREWFEQALVETVIGAQSLQGSPHWALDDIARLWDEEALTAAVLQRYHVDVNVKRSLGTRLGSLKEKVVA
jgi:hypothetical protein